MWDDGDGESGPHLAVSFDRDCPLHGATADPEGWAEADVEDAHFEAARLDHFERALRATMPGLMDGGLIRRAAQAGMAAEDAHYETEWREHQAARRAH